MELKKREGIFSDLHDAEKTAGKLWGHPRAELGMSFCASTTAGA